MSVPVGRKSHPGIDFESRMSFVNVNRGPVPSNSVRAPVVFCRRGLRVAGQTVDREAVVKINIVRQDDKAGNRHI